MTQRTHALNVAGIVQETRDARSFILEVPRALRDAFRYQAGQFLTFEIEVDAVVVRRCYSLASAPESDAWPKVTVKRIGGGRVSNWFNDRVKLGDVVHVLPPEGRFVLHAGEARPLFLFGAGSGITPIVSLVKSALTSTTRDVHLVYANRDDDSILFRDELELLKQAFPSRLSIVHHLDVERGFLTRESAATCVGERAQSEFYVCGPTPFMDAVEAALEARGVAHEHRHFERFVSPVDPDRRAELAPATATTPSTITRLTVVLDGTRHDIAYAHGESLLQACKNAGLEAPSSCEDGFCGCCMAFKRSGVVTMAAHEALTPNDLERGWVLPCQARAVGGDAVEIDFDEKY